MNFLLVLLIVILILIFGIITFIFINLFWSMDGGFKAWRDNYARHAITAITWFFAGILVCSLWRY